MGRATIAPGMTTLRVTFLGTSAAVPTAGRNLSGLFVKREGDAFLFDCGEGTQRQMIRFGTGFGMAAVFFTHFHADHYLGITGMLRTLAMQNIGGALTLYGPRPAGKLLPEVVRLGLDELPWPVRIVEIEPGVVWRGNGYRIEAFETVHRVTSVGYALVEDPRPGRFDTARARSLGIPPWPLFGRLQRGEPALLPDGRTIAPESVLGPARPGRRLVISGDTRPCPTTIAAAEGADLVVHESTFGEAEQARAIETRHSTAREAAQVAREARARRLVLTHLSNRYDTDPGTLLAQARPEFAACEVAEDGHTLDLPLPD
jgi:ribonuclease Z